MACMDDIIERECASEPITLDRCRELLAEEASELSDEQVDAIRRHTHAHVCDARRLPTREGLKSR